MNSSAALRRLGRRLRALRTAAGIDPETLAAALGLAAGTLAAIEAGTVDADYTTLRRIARVLGRPVADLLAAMDDGRDEEEEEGEGKEEKEDEEDEEDAG